MKKVYIVIFDNETAHDLDCYSVNRCSTHAEICEFVANWADQIGYSLDQIGWDFE